MKVKFSTELGFPFGELVKYGNAVRVAHHADIELKITHPSRWDDGFELHSRGSRLVISGRNVRSVLYGVYSFLERHGFAFHHPGPDGEIIPEQPRFHFDGFEVTSQARCRYRGISEMPIRGNWEKSEAMIDWMAKNRYNLYFQEGFNVERPEDPWTDEHPLQHVEYQLTGVSWEERRKIANRHERLLAAAAMRGLLIERGGHGFNAGLIEHYAQAVGLSTEESCKVLQCKGNVNRRRELASPCWMQLCLAGSDVRAVYADHIADYIEKHQREFDICAVWLGDGYDNHCQCPACVKQPFSDQYLDIVSRVAHRCAISAPTVKIEVLIYFETLEPPTSNRLEGCENVLLNLAPWGQCHQHRMDDPQCRFKDWEPDYRFNHSHDAARHYRPLNHDQFSAYCGWRKVVGNKLDCHIFNYITLSNHPESHFLAYDFSCMVRDIDDFSRLGFNGITTCKGSGSTDRPANLQLFALGRALWGKVDATEVREELFEALFGAAAGEVARCCDRIAAALCSCDWHLPIEDHPPALRREIAAELEAVRQVFSSLAIPVKYQSAFTQDLQQLIVMILPS